MLGAFAGLTAELASGKSIIEQYRCEAQEYLFIWCSKRLACSCTGCHAQNIECMTSMPCRMAPGPIAGVFLLFAVASLIPVRRLFRFRRFLQMLSRVACS